VVLIEMSSRDIYWYLYSLLILVLLGLAPYFLVPPGGTQSGFGKADQKLSLLV
jgi:hypothetical protein